ncbi:putative leader peptide [Streptomyces sp. NPDC001903]
MARTVGARVRILRRCWLTRRLHIDLLRVSSAFRASA